MKLLSSFNRISFYSLLVFFLVAGSHLSFSQRKKNKDKKAPVAQVAEATDNGLKKEPPLSEAEIEEVYLKGMGDYVMGDYKDALESFLKADKANPKLSAVKYQTADVYLKLNQPENALKFIKEAIDLKKDNAHYYLMAAEIYSRKAAFQSVIDTYLALIENVEGTEEYYFDLASAYLQTGKYKDAIIAYNKVETEYGMNEGITRQKQRIYLQMNDLESAIKEGDRFLAEYPEVVEFGVVQARLLLSNDRLKEALPLIEKLAHDFPHEGGVNLIAAEYYRKSGEAEKSKQELLKAFKSRSLSFESKMEVLAGYFQVNPDPAARAFGVELAKISVEIHPDSDKANAMYGDFLLNEKEFTNARHHYLLACKINPNQYATWRQIIGLDYQLQQYDSMIIHAEDALEIFPNQVDLYLLKGTAHSILKQFEMAMEIFEQGKMFATDLKTAQQFNEQLGDVYQQLEMYRESAAAYREALKTSPDNLHVLNNFSYYLSLRKENLDEAKRMSARLIELAPNNPSYLDTHGWVHYQLGSFNEAVGFIEKAARLSNSAVIHEHYGDALFKIGQKEKAIEQWKKAASLSETASPELLQKIKTGALLE